MSLPLRSSDSTADSVTSVCGPAQQPTVPMTSSSSSDEVLEQGRREDQTKPGVQDLCSEIRQIKDIILETNNAFCTCRIELRGFDDRREDERPRNGKAQPQEKLCPECEELYQEQQWRTILERTEKNAATLSGTLRTIAKVFDNSSETTEKDFRVELETFDELIGRNLRDTQTICKDLDDLKVAISVFRQHKVQVARNRLAHQIPEQEPARQDSSLTDQPEQRAISETASCNLLEAIRQKSPWWPKAKTAHEEDCLQLQRLDDVLTALSMIISNMKYMIKIWDSLKRDILALKQGLLVVNTEEHTKFFWPKLREYRDDYLNLSNALTEYQLNAAQGRARALLGTRVSVIASVDL
ncbi:hypothetical protein ONZ51_g11289 [Trametes cubensis]|uniref:Uncharacterized protein n=1 Tax=Trametes cubensis TaxID=1111947 RepID=A0AAD7TJI4_9APHY|nr:hypothetical protein ONZ51_g11289 [Trametes cubensis]